MSVAQTSACQGVFSGSPVPVSGGAGAKRPLSLSDPKNNSDRHARRAFPVSTDSKHTIHEQSADPIPGIRVRRDMSQNELWMVETWRKRWRDVEGSSLYLRSLRRSMSGGEIYSRLRPANSSRYHVKGRRRLQRRVLSLWGERTNPVCMLTLTFDPKRTSREAAWRSCTSEVSRLLDALWVWRKRHGKGKGARPYLWVVEEQPGTGMPHVHLLVEDVWLAPAKWLAAEWGHGRTQVQKCGSGADSGRYVAKYVAKLAGWSDMGLAYLARYRLRLYAVSQVWRNLCRRIEKPKEWEAVGLYLPSRGFGRWRYASDGSRRIEWLDTWWDSWRLLGVEGDCCEDAEKEEVEYFVGCA